SANASADIEHSVHPMRPTRPNSPPAAVRSIARPVNTSAHHASNPGRRKPSTSKPYQWGTPRAPSSATGCVVCEYPSSAAPKPSSATTKSNSASPAHGVAEGGVEVGDGEDDGRFMPPC